MFAPKPSKLSPETFWDSLGPLEPLKWLFCDFWKIFESTFLQHFPIPVCFLLLLKQRGKTGQHKVKWVMKDQKIAQDSKFWGIRSKPIQTFPRNFLGLQWCRNNLPDDFSYKNVCSQIRSRIVSVSKVAENTRESKQKCEKMVCKFSPKLQTH